MSHTKKVFQIILRPAGLLFGFALVFTFLLVITYTMTRDKIEASEQATQLILMNQILPQTEYDNPLLQDKITIYEQNNAPKIVYRARKGTSPIAVIFEEIAPDGYNGKIKLLIAIRTNGTVAGVRVIQHHETPGLGDYIELTKSTWILQLTGKSLNIAPKLEQWHVKKDGGIFSYRTGATITPRAVIKAVHHALLFYQRHQTQFFTTPFQQ